LLDDLAAQGIRVVTARHEGSAAFMAEALAQSTGRPQIVAVSRAVGAANAAIGIHTASQDSADLVTLVGQVQTAFRGREAFQGADLVGSIGSLASWAAQVDTPQQAVPALDEAWRRLTTGRPGPIVLSVPEDIQSSTMELVDEPLPQLPGARGGAADRAAVSRALRMIAASERGVIVAGGGVLRARATKRLIALSEALAVPVVAAWRRPDVFPNDHANYLGMAGAWSAPTVSRRLADADVILFIGARLSEVTTAGYRIPGPETRCIHVDVEPRVAHAGLPAPTVSIAADASRFLDTAWSDLKAAALDNEMRSRREARNAADREAYRTSSEVGQGTWDGPGLHPGRVVIALRSALPDNATITTDSGNLAAFIARGFRFRRAGTFIGATSGSMGFGLPAAIAASLSDPDRITVAVCGDGGFAMSMAELETSVREGAHPIAVVFDNQGYGTISVQQSREARDTRSTELGAIDFAALARAHGASGFSVSAADDFEPALRESISSRKTSVIHVAIDRAWRSVDDTPVAIAG
jgi:acetolactate synthase-1/2/3 large subunit